MDIERPQKCERNEQSFTRRVSAEHNIGRGEQNRALKHIIKGYVININDLNQNIVQNVSHIFTQYTWLKVPFPKKITS